MLAGQGQVARVDVVAHAAEDDAHVGRGVLEELGIKERYGYLLDLSHSSRKLEAAEATRASAAFYS